MTPEPLLAVRGLVKTYLMAPEKTGGAPRRVEVLRGIDLDLAPGEMVALTGASGSGKSTFLNVIGRARRADARRGALRRASPSSSATTPDGPASATRPWASSSRAITSCRS